MRQKKGFSLREVCGRNVVVPEGLDTIDFGKMITMNSTAAWLWNKTSNLDEFTAEQLADALCEEYSVEKEKALEDVVTELSNWKKYGIIED